MKTAILFGFPAWLLSAAAAAGAVANGGFEGGQFSGWDVSIATGIVQGSGDTVVAGSVALLCSNSINYWGGPPPYQHLALGTFANPLPVEGDWLAGVGSGNTRLAGAQVYDLYLSQNLALNQGDSLSGWAQFFNGDFVAQDSAWVRILDGSGVQLANPWQDVSGGHSTGSNPGVPYQGSSPWTFWQWQAPTNGLYTLELGATTRGDDEFDSYGFYDGVTVSVAPEPGPGILLLIGCGLLALTRVPGKRRCQ